MDRFVSNFTNRLDDALKIVIDKKSYCAQCHFIADFAPDGQGRNRGPNLADVYRANHQPELALPIFEDLIARVSDRPGSWQVVAFAHEGAAEIAVARRDLAAAAAHLEKMIAVTADHDPETLRRARLLLAAAYKKLGRRADAARLTEEAGPEPDSP